MLAHNITTRYLFKKLVFQRGHTSAPIDPESVIMVRRYLRLPHLEVNL